MGASWRLDQSMGSSSWQLDQSVVRDSATPTRVFRENSPWDEIGRDLVSCIDAKTDEK
jgi:hypothetical protein